MDDVLSRDQIGERRRQEDDARKRKLKVQHRIQVTKPLAHAQAGAE